MGDVALLGRRLALLSCYWQKAENAGGPGAEPLVVGLLFTHRYAKPNEQHKLS